MKTALKDYQMWGGSSKTSSRGWSGSVINVVQVHVEGGWCRGEQRKRWMTNVKEWVFTEGPSHGGKRPVLLAWVHLHCAPFISRTTGIYLSPTHIQRHRARTQLTEPFNFSNFKLWHILEVSYGRSSVVLSTPSVTITTVCWLVN